MNDKTIAERVADIQKEYDDSVKWAADCLRKARKTPDDQDIDVQDALKLLSDDVATIGELLKMVEGLQEDVEFLNSVANEMADKQEAAEATIKAVGELPTETGHEIMLHDVTRTHIDATKLQSILNRGK